MDQIEELIRTYIHLPHQPASTGWYPILCKACNDHGRKGPRAAFFFEEGAVAYHCFNCGRKPSYKTSYKKMPEGMRKVLEAFGIPDDEINKLRLLSLQERDQGGSTTVNVERTISINPEPLILPDHFYQLNKADQSDKWAEIAKLYLEERKINPNDYPFYLSTGVPTKYNGPESQKTTFVKAAQKWKKRLIIPIYKDDNLIYYQGRDMTGRARKKYESPGARKDRVLYGFDQLFTDSDRPLYVVEGFFDAFHINGVALLGSELTEPQAMWLNKSRRNKVFVPDRGDSGARIARDAIKQGWRISFPVEPDSSANIQDVSDAIVKYGRLYVLNTLREQMAEGRQAELKLSLYCK